MPSSIFRIRPDSLLQASKDHENIWSWLYDIYGSALNGRERSSILESHSRAHENEEGMAVYQTAIRIVILQGSDTHVGVLCLGHSRPEDISTQAVAVFRNSTVINEAIRDYANA